MLQTTESFWLNKRDWQPVAKVNSIHEMVEALKKAPVDVVNHHMAGGKNDFAAWVEKVLKEPDLAKKLRAVKLGTPQETLKKVIAAFESVAKKK